MPPPIPPDLWIEIRTAYMEGSETYAQLAERFKISKASVEARASARTGENWGALRQAFRLKQQAEDRADEIALDEPALAVQATVAASGFTNAESLDLATISSMVDFALMRCGQEIESAPVRNFEQAVSSLTKLVDLRLKLRPPSPGEWALVAMTEFGLNAKELVKSVSAEWEKKK